MIRLLIVDDSSVARELLRHIFAADPEFDIAGIAACGEEAVRMAVDLRPDVITMDIHMPGMDGYVATRQIMERAPTPIVIVSASTSPEEVDGSFKALEAGAMALFERPVGVTHPSFAAQARQLRELVRAVSEVPVVRRWSKSDGRGRESGMGPATSPPASPLGRRGPAGVVCIGASTGGPVIIQTILRDLGRPFPLPVIVVQHIAVGFLDGFVEWMETTTGFPIRIAQAGERLVEGTALIAPDGHCVALGPGGQILLVNSEHACTLRPSVDHLFESASIHYPGRVIGVLLSGMGRDGAAGLLRIRESGGKTIAQDEMSCVVYGMPGEAARLGAVEQSLSPARIGKRLNELANEMVLK